MTAEWDEYVAKAHAEWDECVVKAQQAVEMALSVGDAYVDVFEKLTMRHHDAQKRLNKLLYWLDIDSEMFETMSHGEKANHLYMQKEVQAIKDILLGKEKTDG